MLQNEYPILEFDGDRNAFIRASNLHRPIGGISERCVLCFFSAAIEKLLAECPHKTVAHMRGEGVAFPVHELEYGGGRVALVQSIAGAPWAAGHIEELAAFGYRKFIACGGCGVLEKDIAVGHLVIPVAAVRDEGTSYHYAAPSREIEMDGRAARVIEGALLGRKVPYIKGKTWTTDAFFRETPARVRRRRQEGCVVVEMETSAFIAAARFNGVEFGQILYGGDSLAGDEWDDRGWNGRGEIREFVLRLALDACLGL